MLALSHKHLICDCREDEVLVSSLLFSSLFVNILHLLKGHYCGSHQNEALFKYKYSFLPFLS